MLIIKFNTPNRPFNNINSYCTNMSFLGKFCYNHCNILSKYITGYSYLRTHIHKVFLKTKMKAWKQNVYVIWLSRPNSHCHARRDLKQQYSQPQNVSVFERAQFFFRFLPNIMFLLWVLLTVKSSLSRLQMFSLRQTM